MAGSPELHSPPEVDFHEAPNAPKRNPALAAALVGGAAAAAVGAAWGARAYARRKAEGDGKPLNAVMENAVTACELAHHSDWDDPEIQPSAHPRLRR